METLYKVGTGRFMFSDKSYYLDTFYINPFNILLSKHLPLKTSLIQILGTVQINTIRHDKRHATYFRLVDICQENVLKKKENV